MPDSMDSPNFGFDLGPSKQQREVLTGHELWRRLTAAMHRDRQMGPAAASVCGNCGYDTAVPEFLTVDGETTVTYECVRCGELYL